MDEAQVISTGESSAAIEAAEGYTTVENGSPYECFPQQTAMQKIGMFAGPCIFGAIYLAVAIFLIVLFYRLVRATENIASKLEGGITVNKEESNNTI
jgi:hypothetical protein